MVLGCFTVVSAGFGWFPAGCSELDGFGWFAALVITAEFTSL